MKIIRSITAYAFPVWFDITSNQMERLRIWERRILVSCLGLRPAMGPDGVMRRPSCEMVYSVAGLERIDVFLVRCALGFLEKASTVDNGLVRGCLQGGISPGRLLEVPHRPPVCLAGLEEQGLLFRDGRLLFYNRRFGSTGIEDLVYNTAQ